MQELDVDAAEPRVIGRDSQFKQLELLLLTPSSPSTIVLHGSEASGKTATISSFLQQNALTHTILQCRECITARHLFERVIAQCSLQGAASNQRCESVNAFINALQAVLVDAGHFTLVLDGIDELRDAPPSLMPAMARIGSLIPDLTVVLVVRYPSHRALRTTGLPYIYFPPYTREQASAILALNPPNIFPPGHQSIAALSEDEIEGDSIWLWSRFCQAVWDALAKGAANDLVSFRALCERLWRSFIQPVVDGTFGTRDFSRLVVHQRRMLQEETCLEDNLLVENEAPQTKHTAVQDFPYFTKWLLCAAYLASHNPIKTDVLHFMKSTERKRKKKGGGTAAGRMTKSRKIPRHLLSPAAFTIDRLLSILHVILPHDLTTNIDIYSQITTLTPLRLLLRGSLYNSDPLDRGAKWRINYDWDYAMRVARSIEFDMTDYVAE